MKVTKTKPVPKVTKQTVLPQTTRNTYKGVDDPAFFIHHNKTHRSASEAFRDADYATAFYRERTDMDDFVQFCSDGRYLFPLLVVFIGVIFYVAR
jgi:hypothetical protein